jgi:hypothetical protein
VGFSAVMLDMLIRKKNSGSNNIYESRFFKQVFKTMVYVSDIALFNSVSSHFAETKRSFTT